VSSFRVRPIKKEKIEGYEKKRRISSETRSAKSLKTVADEGDNKYIYIIVITLLLNNITTIS
jgi:hypothetical protein